MFINRTNELKSVEDEYNRKNATFSVVYGRRRVGKTSLLSKYIERAINNNFNELLESVYKSGHNTEAALVQIKHYMMMSN